MLNIIIAGIGGIGMNLAISLSQIEKIADIPIDSLYLIDPDIIEEKNLNRLPMKKYIGQPKTHALLKFINDNIRRDLLIHVYMGDARSHLVKIIDRLYCDNNNHNIVIDCTDRTIIQKDIIDICRSYNISYMRIGNENNIVTIEINKNYAETLKKHFMGYESTPTNPFYVGGTLSIVYYHLNKLIRRCINKKEYITSKTYDLDNYEKLNHIYNSI